MKLTEHCIGLCNLHYQYGCFFVVGLCNCLIMGYAIKFEFTKSINDTLNIKDIHYVTHDIKEQNLPRVIYTCCGW